MDRLGDEFLACAAFSVDQHSRTRWRHLPDQIQHGKHLFALADNVGKVVALLQSALELNIFLAQAAAFDGVRDLDEQFVVRPRLGDVIQRAALERGPRHVDRAVRRDQNYGEMWVAPPDFTQQIESIAIGEADVKQKQIERFFLEKSKSRFAGFRAGSGVALGREQQLQSFANFRFVVDDEDGALRHVPLSAQPGIPAGMTCLYPEWSERQPFLNVP